MKKEVLLIITILLSTAVYATCDVTDTLDKTASESYTVDGRDHNITFSSLTNESGDILVKFRVNGITTDDLEQGMKYTFSDLSEITVSSINIGVGSANDSAQFCFNAGLSCVGCGTCTSNSDCDDNNLCTIDECDGDPLRCRRTLILWCKDDDGCCQESRCTAEKDNDCGKPLLIGCINDSECNDNNTLTMDTCDNNTKICNNAIITECISNDTLCPNNCTFISDTDCDECSEKEDCGDNNACTLDFCSGSPKRCSNNATTGCDLNGKCIYTGIRTEDQFCNKENVMESLRLKKEYCDNDYECLSNICKKNKCKNPSFFKKMGSWFKGFFGK